MFHHRGFLHSFAIILHISMGYTENECDRIQLWRNPLSCDESLPCLFMVPLIEEAFPSSWSKQQICKLPLSPIN